MSRDKQHRRIFIEGCLSAVAMVHIPIHDQDPLRAIDPFKIVRADGNRIEQTKAHGLVVQSVVARGAYQGKAIIRFLGADGIDQTEQAAGGQQTDAERIAAGDGIAVQRVLIVLRSRRHQRHVLGAMADFYFTAGRGARRQNLELLQIDVVRQIE
jgi:hypothetical protein